MTTSEFRKLVSEASNVTWFNSIEFDLKFPAVNQNKSFVGLSSLHKFSVQQISGWEKKDILPPEMKASIEFFKNLRTQLEAFINGYSSVEDGNSLTSHFKAIRNNIAAKNVSVFTYESPEVDFLINVYKENSQSSVGAYTYIIGDLNQNINSKDIFNGYLLAYEFVSKSKDLLRRLPAEKAALTQLRNNFENTLPELEQQLISHLKNIDEKYKDYVSQIDRFQIEKEKTYSDWFINAKGEASTFDKESKSKLVDLENTYQEKLKLEGPATYWSHRAKKLRRQGWIALIILVLLILIVCDSLSQLLWRTPEQIYSSFFNNDKSTAVRWAIVYVTLLSFVAYCVKALSKVMFSSFHLARDSEERHTLTYFYLSLLRESTIDSQEKQLIMQSLFSRADTGLLKEDSSPTMPNDLAKIFNQGR